MSPSSAAELVESSNCHVPYQSRRRPRGERLVGGLAAYPPAQRPNSTQLWGLAWEVGGRSQRVFVILQVLGPGLSAAMLLTAAVLLYSLGRTTETYEVFYTCFVALVAWTAFQRAIYVPMFGPAFWRAAMNRGWTLEKSKPFYEELARYKEERGINGQLPGDVAWGLAYFAIYLGTMIVAILMVLFLYGSVPIPVVFLFALVEFPIAFGCMLLYRRRSWKQFDRAIKEGYPFSQFRLGALHRLLP